MISEHNETAKFFSTQDHIPDEIRHSGSPTRVLLVEDDEDDYLLTRELLADFSGTQFRIDWVSTYEAGLTAMTRNTHDVVLLDYNLGARTGLDLIREGQEKGCELPIMMLTGCGGELIATHALQLGATDYLPKNLASRGSLERGIMNALEKAKLRKNLEDYRRHLEENNQTLVRKNEEVQRFYHTVAHELTTPLTAGREFASIILDGLAGSISDEQCEYLGLVKDCFDQMSHIVNDLLDTTRIETGKLSIHQRSVPLGPLITRILTEFKPVGEEKGITLRSAVEPGLPNVFIDEHRIAQVLNNLLSNAMKFTPAGGEITVKACPDSRNPTHISVSVTDTGCGIAPGDLHRIFDRLYQVETAHERLHGGLGLGLAISQEVVRLHGGTLSVESSLGRGSTFFFTIPKENATDG